MSIAVRGDDIDLTLFLTKNKEPYASQAVVVDVFRQEDGTQEITSQSLSEVSTGLYTWKWSSPPNIQINLLAEFTINSIFVVGEEIQIIDFEMGEIRSAIDEMVGIIEDTEGLSGVIDDTLEVSSVVEDTLELEAVVEETLEIEAIIEDNENTEAIVQDSK